MPPDTSHESRVTSYGFTLLEVLLATLLLTVGVLGIVWAFSAGMFASTDVENVDLALNIAQAKMEDIFQDLKTTDLTSLVLATYETSHSGTDADFSNFSIALDLTDQNPPDQDLLQADVTVSWDTKGGTERVTLTTLVND